MDLVVLLDVFSHFRGVCCLKRAFGHIALEVTGILVSNAFAMLRGLWRIKTGFPNLNEETHCCPW